MAELTFLSTSSEAPISQIINDGHVVYLPLDGSALDIDIKSEQDIESIAFCPRCKCPHIFNFIQGGGFISCRCITESCRIERENNQIKRENIERKARQLERTHEPSFLKRFAVPVGYYHCTFDNFGNSAGFTDAVKYITAIWEFLTGAFRTLLLTGNTGVGKTHLAVGILRYYSEQGQISLRFSSAAGMISQFKEIYEGKGTMSERDLIREYTGISFLTIDDLGVENVTPNSIALIQQIIEERISRPDCRTVITSNFNIKKLESMYGSRLTSRLSGTTGKVIHIIAPDYRKRDDNS